MNTPIAEKDEIVTKSLSTILDAGDHSGRPFNVLIGSNMGNRTLIFSVPMAHFYEISEVANKVNLAQLSGMDNDPVAQRKLDDAHAKRLAKFILKGLIDVTHRHLKKINAEIPTELLNIQQELGSQPYISMQPITTNIRNCDFGGDGLRFRKDGNSFTVYLSDKHVLWVIDGQHRRYAMHLVFEFLKTIIHNGKYSRKPVIYEPNDEPRRDPTSGEIAVWSQAFELARTEFSIAVECHLGLDFEQERQLFHDLNNLGKTVDGGLVYEFDNSNPVNRFVKETLINDNILKAKLVESENKSDWNKDEGTITRKDLISINALLFLNKTTIRGALPSAISSKQDFGIRFWECVGNIPGWGETDSKKKTIAAQPVVLKSLAKLAYDFAYGREKDQTYLDKLFDAIQEGDIDFSHENKLWRYFELRAEERDTLFPGLKDSVTPEDSTSNIDLGSFDQTNRVFRFGAKHNDILRHLGDLIRWRIGLPKRPALEKMQEERAAFKLLDNLILESN